MNNITLILSAVMMIFSFCGSTIADTPAAEDIPQETAAVILPAETLTAEENPVPESSPAVPASEEAVPDGSKTDAPFPEAEPYVPSLVPADPPSSIFDLMDTAHVQTSPAYKVDLASYYLEDMISAAAEGKIDAGQIAEKNRNAAIDAAGTGEQKISFDDLYLLSRVIYSEAGSDWLSDEFRICTGEVVLNRVASPEYPDTIYDVVYQKGQYPAASTPRFASIKPGEDCVDAALRLLQGERRMVPAVVYQSDSMQGELFSMYSDRRLGNTYFCLSPNLEFYE